MDGNHGMGILMEPKGLYAFIRLASKVILMELSSQIKRLALEFVLELTFEVDDFYRPLCIFPE